MRLSTTLFAYIGRHFLVAFLVLLFAFLALIFIFDMVELMRRAASKPEVSMDIILRMTVLKLPHMGQETFPFAALFGGMAAFWRLTRTHELVVARAAGLSAWQFMLPLLVIACLLAAFQVAAVNPLASATLAQYQRLDDTYLQSERSALSLSGSSLWLRQASDGGNSVVHASTVLQTGEDIELRGVMVLTFQGAGEFVRRIDAEGARLEDGMWYLWNVRIHVPEEPTAIRDDLRLDTDLTLAKIQDSFAPPETMSFWALPAFIRTLEAAGFAAQRHRMHWHSLLSAPLLMCAMILIAATFTLRQAPLGGTTFVICGGVLAGFLLYFFSDFVYALGLSSTIPVVLAAWTPPGVAILLGMSMLFHLEDG